ncbi:hypothetical protein HMPREF1544_05976 [Mucor circinelloides 1006PhL]|uniref:Uncharacterized protein n=1 Tax=Mucor circinelloides f. circinelloides (strain 1006PhL) TaxID=1220926 RepID=S2JBV5_MUCC1|nr:hypothetical protein HMPREF1544_05976 [Mucor circinelloides 1006PhL]
MPTNYVHISGVNYGLSPFLSLQEPFGSGLFMASSLENPSYITTYLMIIRLRIVPYVLLPHTAPITDTILLQHLIDLLQCQSPSLDRDESLPFADLSLHQLFACTLLAIWQAHWRWIFDTTPFLLIPVRHCLTRFLTQLDAELHLDL